MAAPFGATVDGARQLVQDVAQPGEGIRPSARLQRVSDDAVEGWLEAGAARVWTRIPEYEQLPVVVRDQVEVSARHLCELYAGALLFDVLHPERAQSGGRLAAALMERFTADLGALAADVDKWTQELVEADPVPGGTVDVYGGGGAAGSFRAPSGWETLGF